MCCGQGPALEEIVMAAPGRAEGSMAKVYTTVPGARVRISHGTSNYGEATNKVPCEVPEEVAAELEEWMKGTPGDPEKGLVARAPSAEYTIQREGEAPPPEPAAETKRGVKKEV